MSWRLTATQTKEVLSAKMSRSPYKKEVLFLCLFCVQTNVLARTHAHEAMKELFRGLACSPVFARQLYLEDGPGPNVGPSEDREKVGEKFKTSQVFPLFPLPESYVLLYLYKHEAVPWRLNMSALIKCCSAFFPLFFSLFLSWQLLS